MMPDASLVWGGDLTTTPAGDIGMTNGAILCQQRVLRRLLTNLGDYTWQPAYGGGLGQFVGSVASPRSIEGGIRQQMYREADVSHQPEPKVATAILPDGNVFVDISYADVASGGTQALTFSLGV